MFIDSFFVYFSSVLLFIHWLGGSDFVAASVQFNVAASSTRACVNVTILDDNIVESTEGFRLILDPPRSPLNLRLGRRPEVEVDIIDDDSELQWNVIKKCYTTDFWSVR